MSDPVLDAIQESNEVWDSYRKKNDERLDSLEKGEKGRANELLEQLEKMDSTLNQNNDVVVKMQAEQKIRDERLAELEARQNDPGWQPVDEKMNQYDEAFESWFRSRGTDRKSIEIMEAVTKDIQREMAAGQRKAVSIGTPSAGGYAVPEEISRMIENLEQLWSPVRRLVKVVRAGTSDYKELVNLRGTDAGWVGEAGPRPETNTSTLREVVPTHGELYAYPQASEWSLDDMFFDVGAWIAEEVAEAFAINEGQAVISGDGTNKPTGMLNTSPAAGADWPLTRGAEVYEAIAVQTSAFTDVDPLIDLVYACNSRYRARGVFTMNSLSTGFVRKLKAATTGEYYWQPSTQAGQPASLLGYPVETWEDLDDIANGNFPIAFGDFRRGYVLVDRVGMRVTVDANITSPGFIKWFFRRRESGQVLNNNAIKWLNTTV